MGVGLVAGSVYLAPFQFHACCISTSVYLTVALLIVGELPWNFYGPYS